MIFICYNIVHLEEKYMKQNIYVNNEDYQMIQKNYNQAKEESTSQFHRYLTFIGETVLEKLSQLNRIEECKEQLGYSYQKDITNALVFSIEARKMDGKQFILALEERIPGIRKLYEQVQQEILNHEVSYQKQQIVKEVIELVQTQKDGVELTVEDVEGLRDRFPILLNIFVYDYMIEIVTKKGTYHLLNATVDMPEVTVNKSNYFENENSHSLSHMLSNEIGGEVVTGYIAGDLPNNNVYRSWVEKDNMINDVTMGYQMMVDEYYDLFEVEEVCRIQQDDLQQYHPFINVINKKTKEKQLIPYVTYHRIIKENEKNKILKKSFQ